MKRKWASSDSSKKLKEIEDEMVLQSRRADLFRARSVTIGTNFGGQLELSLRMNDGTTPWAPLHPPEAIELINTIAAAIGCHINIKPRDDFASWRRWKDTGGAIQISGNYPNEVIEQQNTPPFLGTSNLNDPELVRTNPELQHFLKEEEKRLAALKVQQEKLTLAKEQTDETMAIKKLKNKRIPKQPAASS